MKKNIPILLLCLVLSFALMGCGRGEKQTIRYTLNPDGTLNKLQWGMTFAQAAQAEKSIAKDNYQTQTQLEQGKDAGEELTILLPQGQLLDLGTSTVQLRFCRIAEEGEGAPLRLTDIRVLFGPGVEREDLSDRVEGALTAMEAAGYSSWAAAAILGDRIRRAALEKARPDWSEEIIQRKLESPLYTASVGIAEYEHVHLSTRGYYQALGEVLGK
ncbi:MAG: hypothetical protein IKX47_02315 [Oscillospiraceae bacterium]|nr:hypothetical protein [Oscillospiraceae bacterium]